MGTVATIGLDLAKSVFQLHGVDETERESLSQSLVTAGGTQAREGSASLGTGGLKSPISA
jgi:hypothetical protein